MSLLHLAVAIANKYSGKAPLTVNFDAAGSTEPDGFIVSYIWDFDDGSNSVEINPTNEFTYTGRHVVTLTVTDNDGLQAPTYLTIRVRTKALSTHKQRARHRTADRGTDIKQ